MSASTRLRRGSIIRLLGWRRPSAVFWRISSVIVDSIYASSDGRFAHIDEKVLERLPSITNGDSTTTVSGIPIVLWITASPAHLHPDSISARPSANRIAMRSFHCRRRLAMNASARCGVSRFQVASGDNDFRPAITAAFPMRIGLFREGKGHGDEPSKSDVFDVRSRHDWRPMIDAAHTMPSFSDGLKRIL